MHEKRLVRGGGVLGTHVLVDIHVNRLDKAST